MINEHEVHMHKGAPVMVNGDEGPHVHNYDNEDVWTIEVYGNGRIIRFLEQVGATEKRCLHDGRLFVVDARQLVLALAEMNGLIIEFRTRRKPQYSEESKAAMRERLAAMREVQKVAVP